MHEINLPLFWLPPPWLLFWSLSFQLIAFSPHLYVSLTISWTFRSNGSHARAGYLSAKVHPLCYIYLTICTHWSFLLLNVKDLLTCWVFARSFWDHSCVPFCLASGHSVAHFLLKGFWWFSSIYFSIEHIKESIDIGEKIAFFRFFLRSQLFKLTISPWPHFIGKSISLNSSFFSKIQIMNLILIK